MFLIIMTGVKIMETNIVYFDETGDDGTIKTSSETFILTSVYMTSERAISILRHTYLYHFYSL